MTPITMPSCIRGLVQGIPESLTVVIAAYEETIDSLLSLSSTTQPAHAQITYLHTFCKQNLQFDPIRYAQNAQAQFF